MSDFPSPRYSIGTTVWKANTSRKTTQLPCPDCLGSQVWRVCTPAGVEMTTPCQRCSRRYCSISSDARSDIPGLDVQIFTPSVSCLTIGSVRIDTAEKERERVSYMCRETGIGSGTIYREPDLFPTEAEAQAAAAEMCAAKNVEEAETPRALVARHFADMTLKPAFRAADWNAVYQSWDVARWHRETIDTVLENEGNDYGKLEGVREYLAQRIDELRRYEFIDRHPFERLLAAAKRSSDPEIKAVADGLLCKFPSGDDVAADDDGETS